MTSAPEVPSTRGATVPADDAVLLARVAELEERLSALDRQRETVQAELAGLRARLAGTEPHPAPELEQCARDVVQVLRDAPQPLTALEILVEVAARGLAWREGTVRHVLADLVSEGMVREGNGGRPHSFALAGPISAGQTR